MSDLFSKIVFILLISAIIYGGMATILILFGVPRKHSFSKNTLIFNELRNNSSQVPQLQGFQARDNVTLFYRSYPSKANLLLVLLHGSGWHSQYFYTLSKFLQTNNLAQVYTPDLRGHGPSPQKRGDLDYIGQLEDDLADFITTIRRTHPDTPLLVGGHSSGGGLAIRFAGSKYGKLVDGYILLSPFLKYNAPTMRPNSGGWTTPYTGRIIGLEMLNNVGIHWFNWLDVIEFNMPQEFRDGTETLHYSYRLNMALAPNSYKTDLSAITQPVLVIAGTADDAFLADKFEPVISQYTTAQVSLLDNVTHMGLVVGEEIQPVLKEWLKSFSKR